MTKRNAWMPFYVGDYLRDTSRLSTEQHGAYLLLIMDYWINGPLPDDDYVLSSIVRLPAKEWVRHRPALQNFFQLNDRKWNHKRVDAERMKAHAITELRSMAGKESANRKAIKRATHVATAGPTNCPQSGQQTATPSQPHISSTESVSANEAACVAGAPQPRSRGSGAKMSDLTSGLIRQSLEAAAGGGRKF